MRAPEVPYSRKAIDEAEFVEQTEDKVFHQTASFKQSDKAPGRAPQLGIFSRMLVVKHVRLGNGEY